jgi:hypothetical protein
MKVRPKVSLLKYPPLPSSTPTSPLQNPSKQASTTMKKERERERGTKERKET